MTITKEKTAVGTQLLSADSHVIESPTIWKGILPDDYFGPRRNDKPGGMDPLLRCGEMDVDGVIAEVLYPTLGLHVFSIEDQQMHEAACHAYNEWLVSYCSVAPDRLVGIGMIPVYDTDRAIEEINWCHERGFRGLMIWQVPHPDLPLRSRHYDPIWEASSRLAMPISFHILTGFEYSFKFAPGSARSVDHVVAPENNMAQLDRLHKTVNLKLVAAMDSTVEMIMSGVFERFPELKIVIVENEIGWLPFAATQWDFYCEKGVDLSSMPISQMPSYYVKKNVYATFFKDVLSKNIFESWGSDTFMWSNDYPHSNSTWPHSQQFVDEQLAGLSEEMLFKVLRGNAERLYGFSR